MTGRRTGEEAAEGSAGPGQHHGAPQGSSWRVEAPGITAMSCGFDGPRTTSSVTQDATWEVRGGRLADESATRAARERAGHEAEEERNQPRFRARAACPAPPPLVPPEASYSPSRTASASKPVSAQRRAGARSRRCRRSGPGRWCPRTRLEVPRTWRAGGFVDTLVDLEAVRQGRAAGAQRDVEVRAGALGAVDSPLYVRFSRSFLID